MLFRGGRREVGGAPRVAETVGDGVGESMAIRSGGWSYERRSSNPYAGALTAQRCYQISDQG